MLVSRISRFVLCATLVVSASLWADDLAKRVDAHLSSGEFGPAKQLALGAKDAGLRDRLLQNIARNQAQTGLFQASVSTAGSIGSDSTRSDALNEVSSAPIGGMPGRGGAAAADFDALIELLKSTVEPESWDDVGGPGAAEPFAGGVFVDSAGLMKRLVLDEDTTLSGIRRDAAVASGNEDVRKASRLRKVSLTRLEREVQKRWALGESPSEAMRALAGLQRIELVLVYPETRDIVIAGPAGDWSDDFEGRMVSTDTGAPVLQLDDLVVVLRNAFARESSGIFGCSINPRKENLAGVKSYLAESAKTPLRPGKAARERWLNGVRDAAGRQDIVVFGIDPRTRAARVLVEADYRMKLVGIGLEPGTVGVESYLDSVPPGRDVPMSVLRWWFTLNYKAAMASESRDAFRLRGPGVKVLSENEMLSERGERIHTGRSDELTAKFASSFTEHFGALARKYPIYAELRNVFDLALVAAIIRAEDLSGQVDWELTHFGPDGAYRVSLDTPATEVESVMNHRLVNRTRILVGVSGGVSVDLQALLKAKAIETDQYGKLSAERAQSIPRELPRNAWWWD